MTLEELRDEIKASMKARDKERTTTLRQVLGEVKNIQIMEQRDATEQDVTNMIKRTIKQTAETLEASIQAATDDERTAKLQNQIAILESLLPQQLSGDALVELIEKTVAELGATSRKDMGRVMKALTEATGGNLDKAQAATEVGSRLS